MDRRERLRVGRLVPTPAGLPRRRDHVDRQIPPPGHRPAHPPRTSQATLDAGAGHMYGTSLPVGGGSTHTVISAHSGLADRLMFDRLRGLGGEARKGDVFYLVTAGHTLAYRVVDISVVDPSDFSSSGSWTAGTSPR